MLLLRPASCEKWPKIMAPTTAPTLYRMAMFARMAAVALCTSCRKVGIEILRAVREKHHEGHQHDQIREALPFAQPRRAKPAPCSPRGAVSTLPIPAPWCGYKAPTARAARRSRTWDAIPKLAEQSRGNRRQQISDRIAALQNPAEHSAPAHRRRFHRQRSAHAPLAAHADAEKSAQNQEHCVKFGEKPHTNSITEK